MAQATFLWLAILRSAAHFSCLILASSVSCYGAGVTNDSTMHKFRTSFDSCVYVEDSVLSLANGNKAARSRQSHQALGDGTRNNCRGIDLPITYHLPLLVGRFAVKFEGKAMRLSF